MFETGSRYLLVVVDRASKLVFTYLLPNKTTKNSARNLLDLRS